MQVDIFKGGKGTILLLSINQSFNGMHSRLYGYYTKYELSLQYSKELYSKILPEETGMSTGYMDVGFIELACDLDRLHYYRRVAAFNRYCGVDVQELSARQVKERFPAIHTDDVFAGFYVATDGRVNPYETTMALAKAAKQRGVTIREGVTVERVTTERDASSILPRVTGVELSNGELLRANVVVNCAGMWARQLGKVNNVNIPNQASEHYYFLTDAMPNIDPSSPVIEDSSKCVYIRPEGGGLMLGLFESKGAVWNAKAIPQDFSFGEIEPDWDRMVRSMHAYAGAVACFIVTIWQLTVSVVILCLPLLLLLVDPLPRRSHEACAVCEECRRQGLILWTRVLYTRQCSHCRTSTGTAKLLCRCGSEFGRDSHGRRHWPDLGAVDSRLPRSVQC